MLLIDAHVHIYDCFNLENFFDSAYTNFKFAAERLGYANCFTGILLLAETSEEYWFQRLTEYADGIKLPYGKNTGKWIFRRTNENNSLLAESCNSKNILLIAGRQIVTSEGLEVLALSTSESFREGIRIKNLIAEINDKGGIPVIPWGFGKWMGHRGTILNQLIESAKRHCFCLGDNGNRPFFLNYPAQLKLAQNKNIRNLPGSDPLPLQSEFKKPGSWGFSIFENLNKLKPTVQLKQLIFNESLEQRVFGKPAGLCRFVKNQFLLKFKKLQ